jgi:hypothetical protein
MAAPDFSLIRACLQNAGAGRIDPVAAAAFHVSVKEPAPELLFCFATKGAIGDPTEQLSVYRFRVFLSQRQFWPVGA